jgi:hypothetical protein
MLRCATLVRTNVSEEHITSIIRMTKISELETLAVNYQLLLRSVLRLLVTANIIPSSPRQHSS